jgi:hypothetical protein
MTPGKAQAHSGHAANAFIFEQWINKSDSQKNNAIISEWMRQTSQGFGTQINLKAPWNEVEYLVALCKSQDIAANLVVDPTYPYEVDLEIFALLPKELHTVDPVFKENGRVICCRQAATAAYIFGDKAELETIVGKYLLHP